MSLKFNIYSIFSKPFTYIFAYRVKVLDLVELSEPNSMNFQMKKLLKAYFQEAKWYHGMNVPTMEEYIKNGIPSSTYLLLATTSWLGMGEVATKAAFDWISSEPTILVASCIIARLLNDLVTHEVLLFIGAILEYI